MPGAPERSIGQMSEERQESKKEHLKHNQHFLSHVAANQTTVAPTTLKQTPQIISKNLFDPGLTHIQTLPQDSGNTLRAVLANLTFTAALNVKYKTLTSSPSLHDICKYLDYVKRDIICLCMFLPYLQKKIYWVDSSSKHSEMRKSILCLQNAYGA